MKKSLGPSTLMTNWKGLHGLPCPTHPLPGLLNSCPARRRPGFSLPWRTHRTNIFSDYSLQSLAGTIRIADLKETIQLIAAHVKAIRRITKWFSIWCPEASKNYTRKGLGRNSFLFGDKKGRSQASVASEERHCSSTPTPTCPQGWPGRLSVNRPRNRGHRRWLVRLFH